VKIDETNKCVLKNESPLGYFFNDKTSKHEKCGETCKSCVENNKKCLDCNLNKGFLYKLEDKINNCVVTCPDGYNNLAEKSMCKLCDKTCKTCEGGIANCNSCNAALFLIEIKLKKFTCSVITVGYYLDKTTNFYRKCDLSCKTCQDDSKKCLICETDFFKRDGSHDSCFPKNSLKTEEFIDSKDYKIRTCDASCKTCKDKADWCLTCNNSNDFYEFKEVKASSMGIYFYFFKYKDLLKEEITKLNSLFI
jgi:proprotein convertase subtilisin/kexin type 5